MWLQVGTLALGVLGIFASGNFFARRSTRLIRSLRELTELVNALPESAGRDRLKETLDSRVRQLSTVLDGQGNLPARALRIPFWCGEALVVTGVLIAGISSIAGYDSAGVLAAVFVSVFVGTGLIAFVVLTENGHARKAIRESREVLRTSHESS